MNILRNDQNQSHYTRLLHYFVRCKRITGNLEITHIKHEDFKNDYDLLEQADGSVVRRQRTPFWFLADLEEVVFSGFADL